MFSNRAFLWLSAFGSKFHFSRAGHAFGVEAEEIAETKSHRIQGSALRWPLFISAGEKASAQNNLGVMYAIGNGMPQYTLASEDDAEILTGISMQGAVSNELKLRMPVAGQT